MYFLVHFLFLKSSIKFINFETHVKIVITLKTTKRQKDKRHVDKQFILFEDAEVELFDKLSSIRLLTQQRKSQLLKNKDWNQSDTWYFFKDLSKRKIIHHVLSVPTKKMFQISQQDLLQNLEASRNCFTRNSRIKTF